MKANPHNFKTCTQCGNLYPNESCPDCINITAGKFEAYLDVRDSGVTNMWAVTTVCELSGLTKSECLEIMKNFSLYAEMYGAK